MTDNKGFGLTGESAERRREREFDPNSRKEPIIVGSGFVASEVVQEASGSALTTADIAGKGSQQTGTAAAPARAVAAPKPEASKTAHEEAATGPLFSPEEAKDMHSRWDAIQVGFVDEPRESVEKADQLVATTIKRLAEVFADERQKLEAQWSRGESVNTEDLRLALRRYRSFFGRLLSV